MAVDGSGTAGRTARRHGDIAAQGVVNVERATRNRREAGEAGAVAVQQRDASKLVDRTGARHCRTKVICSVGVVEVDRASARAEGNRTVDDACGSRRVARGPPDIDYAGRAGILGDRQAAARDKSEEHTSELQSLMRNSYAVFCLKKK